MFNPYVASAAQALRPVTEQGFGGSILSRLGKIDSDDLLILLLIYLLVKEGDQDGIWPLVAAMLYLIL